MSDYYVDPFTCTHCGWTSYNRHDAIEQYCGRCHHFCQDVDQPLAGTA